MRIYLTDLAAYNHGHLVGEWLTLPMEEEELKEALKGILLRGSELCNHGEVHEEYFITDWECDLFDIGEYESIHKLNEKAEKVEYFEEDEKQKIHFLLESNYVSDLDEAIEKVEEVIIHKETTMKGIAEEYFEEHSMLDGLSDMVRNNIDYEGVANDLSNGGNYEVIGGDIFEYIGA